MPVSRPSAPDALLRLWMLAEIGMAGLYCWQAWRMQAWAAMLAPPRPPAAVAVIELMYLAVFIPAAVAVALRWRATRDRWLGLLAAGYGLAAAASFAAWAVADTVGMVRALYVADALISLGGIAVAVRALKLRG